MSSLDDVSDGQTDERTSFVRTAKAQRKYGSTNTIMNEPSLKYQPDSFVRHRVQPGDTLQGIALRYKTSMEYIKRINKMWTNDMLFLREYLCVPCFAETGEGQSNCHQELVLIDGFDDGGSSASSRAEISPMFTGSLNTGNSATAVPVKGAENGDCEKSVKEYLGSMDDQIKEAKSRARTLKKESEILKNHPDLDSYDYIPQSQSSSNLRISNFSGQLNAATYTIDEIPSATVVSGGGRRSKSTSHRCRDEIFEL